MEQSNYMRICRHLILSDLLIFKQVLKNKSIDVGIWVALTVLVASYIMPYFGLQAEFGVFQFAGVLAAIGLFDLYGSVVDMISDFEGGRVVEYRFTLPLPSWMVIASKAAYFGIVYMTLTLIMLPLGKLLLWQHLDMSCIDYKRLFVALFVQNIFYACFTLWAASMVENVRTIGRVWARFIFPLSCMGGFQFSWKALYEVWPTIAWINLINPVIYITEAVRSALIGPQDYLPFWACIGMTIFYALFCLIMGMRRLKQRLDYI